MSGLRATSGTDAHVCMLLPSKSESSVHIGHDIEELNRILTFVRTDLAEDARVTTLPTLLY
jgi:hypothetical protein